MFRGSFTPDQAHILDLVAQSMLHDRIEPVDDGGNDLFIPEEKAAISDTRIEHETQAHIVTLALHAIDPSATTAKAHLFGFAHADAIRRLIRPGRERLSHRGI